MADTIDRRSEGARSNNPSSVASRRKKALFTSLGLCSYCGKTEVKNRVTCYACSEKTQQYAEAGAFRRHLARNGIDKEQLKQELSELPTPEIKKLISLL